MTRLSALSALLVAATMVGAPAAAQDRGLAFTVGAGAGIAPEYQGADEYEAVPALSFSLDALSVGPLSFGDPDPLYRAEGLGLIGSFRYVPGRDPGDSDFLAGTEEIDGAVELGVGLRYAAETYEVFGVVRQGIGGHDGLVGELGGDLIARPSDRLTLRAGPRALFGTGEYVDTYFGVTPAEAGASGGGLAAYDPDGGLVSTGVELGAGYSLGGGWGIDASVRYQRLRDDAAASPITRDDEQVRASIGVTRRFTFGF